MSELTVTFVMRRAASVIRFRGWHQGDYFDAAKFTAGTPLDECAVDALGAVNVAVGNEPGDLIGSQPYVEFLKGVLLDLFGLSDVSAWNDTAGRVADEVQGLFEEAAVRAELTAAVAL